MLNDDWFDDIRYHIPSTPHFNFSGLFRDQSTDQTTGALVCKPKPYPLLDALPELWELSLRYRFKVSVGDQIKQHYSVAADYRKKLAALVACYGATARCG